MSLTIAIALTTLILTTCANASTATHPGATAVAPDGATGGATGVISVAPTTGVGIERCTFVDGTRNVLNYASDPPTVRAKFRTLVTEIRYPTAQGLPDGAERPDATPIAKSSGYPVIVFAHGYDVTPDTYAPLLDAWVRAGFVVVAPFFPDESHAEVTRKEVLTPRTTYSTSQLISHS